MDLIMSHSDPLKTELSTPDGRVLYSVSTPFKLSNCTTKILKYTPNDGVPEPSGSMQEVARINWHSIHPTRIIYNGQIMEVDKFLPRAGRFTDSRTFVGPDGRTYKWELSRAWHLDVDGEQPTTVVKYHYDNIFTRKKARLEVDASALDILDLIVVTWIYMEKTLRDTIAAASAA
ncbi:uncharacterized protein PHACADRAFT_184816 [Phanerochaete carnosa HHB-10118-sp]|uniref:DUF6593 domain-containing protein n=1 Tax=Phanerochaete carnosa (strain HHB-10118-sp) TaxID=650164 RepID=K5V0V5_PHACS|nr:uncharacterized protein PHACADRAFT_184816 [Phanerochaete carnosa HHB-10118-sp]EKM56111.1 hypothetical protein PHACADRAFT_184816 [Phanerochaete carnosa HHB-10118-sp]